MRAVYNILANDATVAASTGGRIYLDRAPQKAASPYIVIVQDSRDPLTTSDPTKADREQIRVLTYSTTLYDDTTGAQTIALQARTALDKYNGTISTDSVYVLYADESVNSLKEANKTFWEVETTFDVWLDKGEALDIDAIIERFPDPMTTTEENNVRRVIQTMYSSGNWSKYDMILALSMTSPANALWNWKTPDAFLLNGTGKNYQIPSSVLSGNETVNIKGTFVTSDTNGIIFSNDSGGRYALRWDDGGAANLNNSIGTPTVYIDGVEFSGNSGAFHTLIADGEVHSYEIINCDFSNHGNWFTYGVWLNNFATNTSLDAVITHYTLEIDKDQDGIYEIRYDGYGRSLTGHDDLITTGLQPVAVNSPTHTPGKGYEMPAAAEYINTNLIPSSDLVNASEDDTHISTYIFKNLDTASTKYFLGVEEAGVSRVFLGQVSGIRTALNGTDSVTTSPPNYLQSRTRYDLHRENSTGYTAYANNVEFINDPSNSIGVAQYPIYLGTLNYQGSPVNHIDLTASHFILGGGFDLTSLNTELNLLESLFIQSIQDQVINIFPNALSTTEETNVRSLVTQMIASGTWFNLENLWVLSMEDATNALYCWKTGTLATAVNGPSHTANQGYLFDGSTNYINTNVTPSDDFRVASLDDIRIEAFVYENLDTDNDGARLFGGSIPAGSTFEFQQNPDTPRIQANVFSASSDKTKYDNQSYFEDNTRYGIGRDDATNQEIFINGVQVDSEADGSDSLSTVDVFIGARNYSAAVNHINARISYLSISNAQDPTSLATDLDTLESLFVTYVAPSYSTEAQAVIDRMPNAMSTNEKNNIATAVDQMVNNGTWAETDYFFMFAMSDATNALTDWKTGLTATAVNGPTHTAGEGYAFDGSTNYLNTGITPSTDLTQASLNDVRVETYVYENLDTNSGVYILGSSSAEGSLYLQQNSDNTRLQVNAFTEIADNLKYTGQSYFEDNTRYGIGRDDATNQELFINGTQVDSEADASSGLPVSEIYIGARNGGAPSAYINATISHFWIGSAQASNLSTDLTLAETTFIS